MDRVIIITGLRIKALHMVNAQDFTYSKGYLGLLSTIGVSLGIIFCCAPSVRIAYNHFRLLAHSDKEIHDVSDVLPSSGTITPHPTILPRVHDRSYDEWMINRRAIPDALTDGLDYWARWKYRTVAHMNAVALRIYDPSLGTSRSASDAA